MRAAATTFIVGAILASGCLSGQPAVQGIEDEEPEDRTLPQVLRNTVQAFLDKDLEYLVEHHSDSFCQTQDGEQVTRQEQRRALERFFASEQWQTMYGSARGPDDVWQLDAASIRNFSQVMKEDPRYEPYEDICDFYPADQLVIIPRAPGASVPENFTGYYRASKGTWVRIGE